MRWFCRGQCLNSQPKSVNMRGVFVGTAPRMMSADCVECEFDGECNRVRLWKAES